MNIDRVEWASFTPLRRAGDYQMSRNGWVMDYNDASHIIELLYSKLEQWGNTCIIVRELLAGATVDECMARFDQLQAASPWPTTTTSGSRAPP